MPVFRKQTSFSHGCYRCLFIIFFLFPTTNTENYKKKLTQKKMKKKKKNTSNIQQMTLKPKAPNRLITLEEKEQEQSQKNTFILLYINHHPIHVTSFARSTDFHLRCIVTAHVRRVSTNPITTFLHHILVNICMTMTITIPTSFFTVWYNHS